MCSTVILLYMVVIVHDIKKKVTLSQGFAIYSPGLELTLCQDWPSTCNFTALAS